MTSLLNVITFIFEIASVMGMKETSASRSATITLHLALLERADGGRAEAQAEQPIERRG